MYQRPRPLCITFASVSEKHILLKDADKLRADLEGIWIDDNCPESNNKSNKPCIVTCLLENKDHQRI